MVCLFSPNKRKDASVAPELVRMEVHRNLSVCSLDSDERGLMVATLVGLLHFTTSHEVGERP